MPFEFDILLRPDSNFVLYSWLSCVTIFGGGKHLETADIRLLKALDFTIPSKRICLQKINISMSSPIMALQQLGTQQIGYWMTYPTGTSTCREDDLCKEARLDGGEISASGDDAPAKIRKPYTITKQRERWTEDEHQKFLEALKLYGRAWRRIEEHIGSKTAVQIRSHAQKFFSKLERKALIGSSTATGGPQDIEIPPPRPKRKPSHPYPRKAGGAFSISSSFEEDNKSPRAVCSAFTPLGSPTELNTWKSMPQTTFPTPSRPLSLEPVNLQEVSHEVQQRAGTSASLRLFGQTVLVPGSEISVLDTEHRIDPSDSIGLESESTASPRSEVSNEFDENSGIQQETDVCSCQPQEAVGAFSDNESSEALVFDSNELLQTCENNMELSKGEQEASQKEQKLNLDLSSRTDGSNDSAISNLASSNSIPCKAPLLPSPHRLSALRHASEVCEGVSPLTLPNISGSCFKPWHPSREVAKQHPAVFPTPARAFWHSLPPEHFFQRSNDDASAAVAVAAASFAVASAWQVIQGAIPTAIGHPNMGMVYSPVAILAAPTESTFGPATMFSGSFSPLEQPTNTNLTCKQERGKLEVNHQHNDGNEIENKLTEMQVNSAVVSTEEGCNSPFETCIISCESSCENIDAAPLKKRRRISHGTGTEACKSLSRTHSPTCDTRLSESERSVNVDIIPFPETDTEVAQHASTDSASPHNSNSLNNEAISVNAIKNEDCDGKKQEIGCSQLLTGQMKQNPPLGLQLPEVCDLQNIPIDEDDNGKKQKEIHDKETQACKEVYTSNTSRQSLLLAEDKGGMQLKDEQQCSAFVEKSVLLPSGSKLDTQADQKLEITSSEESEKNILLTGQLNNGNANRVCIGSYGGIAETGMSFGKHQFVTIGRLASASSYSGVGFVPYKRASGEVKVPRNMVI